MPMKLVDLRLPDEAIALIDTLKPRYPHIAGRPSRTSVILGLLTQLDVTDPTELSHQHALKHWIDRAGIGQA